MKKVRCYVGPLMAALSTAFAPLACSGGRTGETPAPLPGDPSRIGAPPQQEVQGEGLSRSPLLGRWEWTSFQGMDGSTMPVADPSRYTLEIRQNGVFVLADCNRGSGRFQLSGASLRFTEMAVTRMDCPPGSLGEEYVRDLEYVRGWVIEDGNLYLSLWADGGILRFRPAGQDPRTFS